MNFAATSTAGSASRTSSKQNTSQPTPL